MTFQQARAQAAKRAAKESKLFYVYREMDKYLISEEYNNSWLFRAYPGGRKVLSVYGAKLRNEEG